MTKVILKIENDEPFSVSLEDLLDGELEADEAHIRSRLAQCGVYYGGGGAGVRFRIVLPRHPAWATFTSISAGWYTAPSNSITRL